jgi:CelD/BcsL family acetyltransferase involved in cellulose biosynthesis
MAPPICITEPRSKAQDSLAEGLPGLRISVIPAKGLHPRHVAAWRKLQRANPDLANPCFSAEFTQAVAEVRRDVEVGVVEQGRETLALFPFQRRLGARGIPVGGIVSDYQGLICRPGFRCEVMDLLKGCRLVAWDFDRLLASQQCFAPYHKLCEPSAIIDLSNGFAQYARERDAAGTRQLDHCHYMMRRVEREVGPLRFVAQEKDPALLHKILNWKSEQYRRSRWPDLFARAWARGLAEQIQMTTTPGFAGMLSLLYAGPWLIAGHFGMRSDTVWHYWFPAYNRDFAKYSPGLLLLVKMAQQAEHLGLRSIDIGTGITLYKKRLMNASVPVAEGSVERPSYLLALRSARRKLRAWIKG